MSDEMPENVAGATAPVLRREALLPNERNRGLGTVAIVCTMAGVASGLALATTLMAMQVADSMSSRGCPYREAQFVPRIDRAEHGFLGITYSFHDGYADIEKVYTGTPAERADIRPGDHVLSYNHVGFETLEDLQDHIFSSSPGTAPALQVERNGEHLTLRPRLVALPSISY